MRIGIDAGSTTVKVVVLEEDGKIIFSKYVRHNAKIVQTLNGIISELKRELGDKTFSVCLTGSIGMGIAQRSGLGFVQEVIAASKAAKEKAREGIKSMIDIGGEDAKVVFFNDKGEPVDFRMNGNCAAGTGAFIDQMSIILGESIESLSDLAFNAQRVYPIASRCGVFCKTDIQNLAARNVSKADIAASIFHAIAVQTVVTLAHGYDIKPPVLFCGGPLTFIPALREEFVSYLHINENDAFTPENGMYFPAIGAALSADERESLTLERLIDRVRESFKVEVKTADVLPPVFSDKDDYDSWKIREKSRGTEKGELVKGPMDVFLGIDSGSTTTKVVFTDKQGGILSKYYSQNNGDPIGAATRGIEAFEDQCRERGTSVRVMGSCSTGYGEDLMKAAFRLDHGIIETIAHYIAASRLDPHVSFILDIGGQDMKAIYVNEGVINRIEINEACSSGCGSFIQTFAESLGLSAEEFAEAACKSRQPCDLGTRCTVFMNSKVKEALREGFNAEDIAAGLAYSVVRNCLYKVLKLKDTSSLGKHIVVQGGTMKNDAVVKAFENLTGERVSRSDSPELMGAYGCALFAIDNQKTNSVEEERIWAKAI